MVSDLQKIRRPQKGLRCSQVWCHHICLLALGSLEGHSALGSQMVQNGAQNNQCHEGRDMHLGQIWNTWPRGESTDATPQERVDPLLMSVQCNLYVPHKLQQTVNGVRVCVPVTLPSWETQLLAWVHPQSWNLQSHLLLTPKMKEENNFLCFFYPV